MSARIRCDGLLFVLAGVSKAGVAFNMHDSNGDVLVKLGNTDGKYTVTTSDGVFKLTNNMEWTVTFIILGHAVKLL